jgi:hypothetical protein
MISVWFWKKYANRPLHLFGAGGLIIFLAGSLFGLGLIIARGTTVLSICDEEGAEIDVKNIYAA